LQRYEVAIFLVLTDPFGGQLYLDALANSPKAQKTLKDKMAESQAFAVAFAQLALLINLGRLNTTHAMTPESKQPMRYYHPMPALQATEAIRKNLIDSAKFRGMLKAVKLPSEDVVPDTMHKMAAAARAGQRPSTSIVNCLYIMLTDAAVRFVVR
jgi:Ino eighty subunit 1